MGDIFDMGNSSSSHAALARKHMKSLGVYQAEFEPIIKIYAQLRQQYDVLTAEFEASGFDYGEMTQTGSKKATIVLTLENLRKDILTYAGQMGLTPAGLRKLKDAKASDNTSPLAEALQVLSNGA